jgi:hypothetical protein
MSNPDPQDEQGLAEALDDDALGLDEVDNRTGDPGDEIVHTDFPPDHQQGVDVAEPGMEPDRLPPADEPVTGLLQPDDDPDEEVAELGDVEVRPSAEEAAVHVTEEPPMRDRDSYLDD